MATAPVKSQPLHNFSMPYLKWGHKNQVNAQHRYRRHSETTARDSASPVPAEHRLSSPSERDSDSGGGGGGSKNESEMENRRLSVGSRSGQQNRFSFASCSLQKQQAPFLEKESNEADGTIEKEKVCDEIVEAEEALTKPWNLRPRKAVPKAVVEMGGDSRDGELQETARAVSEIPTVQQTENLPKSMRLRGFAEGHSSEKEKRRLWIALSREEIEEDVYAMTGSRPARRPKRRPKTVQKQLDNVSPGMYLVGITADSYRVHMF